MEHFPADMSDDARTPVFGNQPPGFYHDNQHYHQDYAYQPQSIPLTRPPTAFRTQSKLQECEDNQCAEEGWDPEECGDEKRAPARERETLFGFDRRPLLPLGLGGSTIASFMVVLRVHIPGLARAFGDDFFPWLFFVPLYLVTLLSMVYTALCDPGQIHKDQIEMQPDGQRLPPKRSHKSWLYTHPIRRYDHYCRWLMNVIGLLNHRSFFMMCAGLIASVVIGSLVDLALILEAFIKYGFLSSFDEHGKELLSLVLHLGYCCIVFAFLGPIFKLHVGFISRNELAHEWTKNDNYIAWSNTRGTMIPVNDMDDDEFNDAFDFFEYDPSRNPWDKGVYKNCLSFWLVSRDEQRQMGEF